MPPVISLAACYTDAAASQDGISFAARLCAAGRGGGGRHRDLHHRYLRHPAAGPPVRHPGPQPAAPNVVAALSDARREVQAELETSPDKRDNELAGLGEWAAVTVLAAAGSVPVLDPSRTAPAVAQPSRPRIAGLAAREDWYFVGRRRERRHSQADLTGPDLAGIVVHGIGGTGKTTLAAEITTRLLDRDPGRVLVSLTGPLTLESLLGAVTSAIRRELLVRGGQDSTAIQALDVAARADVGWRDRLAILRGHVLDHVPVLAAAGQLRRQPPPRRNRVRGPRRGAGRAAGSAGSPTREPPGCWSPPGTRSPCPAGRKQALSFRQLGALSRAETLKLAWSLPALDQLDERQLEEVWRLAGGHPRCLEYLDALLSGGTARYPDVTRRLNTAITGRLSGTNRGQWLAARTGLDAALAETVALAADDVLLDDLLDPPGPGARGGRAAAGDVGLPGTGRLVTRCCSRRGNPTQRRKYPRPRRLPPSRSPASWPPRGSL